MVSVGLILSLGIRDSTESSLAHHRPRKEWEKGVTEPKPGQWDLNLGLCWKNGQKKFNLHYKLWVDLLESICLHTQSSPLRIKWLWKKRKSSRWSGAESWWHTLSQYIPLLILLHYFLLKPVGVGFLTLVTKNTDAPSDFLIADFSEKVTIHLENFNHCNGLC